MLAGLIIFGLMFGQAAEANARRITIYLAGDSTMAQKLPEKRPETGWGEMLGSFFQDGKVAIDNRAQNGRSTRTFISEQRWPCNCGGANPVRQIGLVDVNEPPIGAHKPERQNEMPTSASVRRRKPCWK